MLKTKRCKICLEELPVHEFRQQRGWKRRRVDVCEKCEMERRIIDVENRRKRYRRIQIALDEAARENRRRYDPADV